MKEISVLELQEINGGFNQAAYDEGYAAGLRVKQFISAIGIIRFFL